MALKRHNTLSAAFAFLFWLFLRDPEVDAPVQADAAFEGMELTADNAHRLARGNWYVVVGDAASSDVGTVLQAPYGIAFLQVTDLSSAALAAQLGVRHANETVALSGREEAPHRGPEGCAHDRSVLRPVCVADVFDYYFFFLAYGVKKRFSARDHAEDALHILVELGTGLLGHLLPTG